MRPERTRFRHFYLPGLLAMCLGCDPSHAVGFAVTPVRASAPAPAASNDSAAFAVAMARRIALRHGYAPRALTQLEGTEARWDECLQANATLCYRVRSGRAEFELVERGSIFGNFRKPTARLRTQLSDSLQLTFGSAAVQPCRWRSYPDPDQPSILHTVFRYRCVVE